MPTANIYYQDAAQRSVLVALLRDLRAFLAERLTCGSKKLSRDEISVRLIEVTGAEMIGAIEMEVTAHAFAERVMRQDMICHEIATYLRRNLPMVANVQVWLLLCELGHSYEE